MKKGLYTANVLLLIVSVFALALITAFLIDYYNDRSEFNAQQQAKDISNRLVESFVKIKQEGKGSSMTINLPEKIGGHPYSVHFSGGSKIWIDAKISVTGKTVTILQEDRPYPKIVFETAEDTIEVQVPYVDVQVNGMAHGGRVKITNQENFILMEDV